MSATWIDEARPALIVGGAGFIGTNLADRLCRLGHTVRLFDNLARPGAETNLRWLLATHRNHVRLELGDVRDPEAVRRAVDGVGSVFHFAAQAAATASRIDPRTDFDVNALGTLNVLEAIRAQRLPPPLLFTSSSKVYGGLDEVPMRELERRYEPTDERVRACGISEAWPLDFQGPHGCSKGAADQYVHDYARSYGLPAVILRLGCVYGPHQLGTADQGWVTHFLMRALADEPITIYGTGKQVRDALYVDDLMDAMLLAHERMDTLSGRAFNLGGGPTRTLSLLELASLIGDLHGAPPATRHDDWRAGDQRYFVSDTRAFKSATGWRPTVDVPLGVRRLNEWLVENRPVEAAVAHVTH